MYSLDQVITPSMFKTIKAAGLIVEAKTGGLLVGPTKAFGGIPTITKSDGGYVPGMEAEGFMFMINPNAAKRFWYILEGLNDVHLDIDRPDYLERTPDCKPPVLDCHYNAPGLKYGASVILLIDPEAPIYLVNRYSTWRHMEMLHWMNTVEPWRD